MWDKKGISYNKRYNLLLVEIEMVSHLMCDLVPFIYTEKDLWFGKLSQEKTISQGKYVITGHKKWFD